MNEWKKYIYIIKVGFYFAWIIGTFEIDTLSIIYIRPIVDKGNHCNFDRQ